MVNLIGTGPLPHCTSLQHHARVRAKMLAHLGQFLASMGGWQRCSKVSTLLQMNMEPGQTILWGEDFVWGATFSAPWQFASKQLLANVSNLT